MQLPITPRILIHLQPGKCQEKLHHKKHCGSLQHAQDANSNSPLGMRTEFRKIPTIEVIFYAAPHLAMNEEDIV
jgi:hypothetical protein